MHEWLGVEHPQLVELPVVHAVGEKHADVFPLRPPGGEVVLDDPLAEGLGDDRPGDRRSRLLVDEPRPIGVGGLRRDAVDHRVRERCRTSSTSRTSSALARLAHRQDRPRPRRRRCPGRLSQLRMVSGASPRQTPGVEAGGDRLERRRSSCCQGVAGFGDSERQDRQSGSASSRANFSTLPIAET